MKNKILKFSVSAIGAFLIALTLIPQAKSVESLASNISKKLDAYYSVNEIVIDGVKTGKGSSAFISEGTTYVPLRFIADSLGAEVSWDQATKTITINSNRNVNNNSSNIGNPTDLPTASTNSVNTAPTTSTNFIGEEKARQIAISKAGGGTVIKFESDLYDRTPDYNVDVLNNGYIYEIEIDAITGSIKKFEVDRD